MDRARERVDDVVLAAGSRPRRGPREGVDAQRLPEARARSPGGAPRRGRAPRGGRPRAPRRPPAPGRGPRARRRSRLPRSPARSARSAARPACEPRRLGGSRRIVGARFRPPRARSTAKPSAALHELDAGAGRAGGRACRPSLRDARPRGEPPARGRCPKRRPEEPAARGVACAGSATASDASVAARASQTHMIGKHIGASVGRQRRARSAPRRVDGPQAALSILRARPNPPACSGFDTRCCAPISRVFQPRPPPGLGADAQRQARADPRRGDPRLRAHRLPRRARLRHRARGGNRLRPRLPLLPQQGRDPRHHLRGALDRIRRDRRGDRGGADAHRARSWRRSRP